jgi:hypothetical protein
MKLQAAILAALQISRKKNDLPARGWQVVGCAKMYPQHRG